MAGRQVPCTKCHKPLTIPRPEVDLASANDLAGALSEIDDLALDLDEPGARDPLGLGAGKKLPAQHRSRRSTGSADNSRLLYIAGGCIGGCVLLLVVVIVVQSMSGSNVATNDSSVAPIAARDRFPERRVPFESGDQPTDRRDLEPQDDPAPPGTPTVGPSSNRSSGRLIYDARTGESYFSSETEKASPSQATGSATPPSGPRLDLGIQQWFTASGRSLRGAIPTGQDDETVVSQYSWMTQLLPYLGHEKVFHSFDLQKPWTDKKNAMFATAVIPDFLSPGDSRQRWQGGELTNLGLTHFVGITGVDERNRPAAVLPRSDPRAGIFGYTSVARTSEITDGTSNTLMIAGAGHLAGPWVAGGGSTLRGVKDDPFAKLTGFSTAGSRPGTFAVLADGSTRFISADIDPSVFRALSTIHGGESVDSDAMGSPEIALPTQRKR